MKLDFRKISILRLVVVSVVVSLLVIPLFLTILIAHSWLHEFGHMLFGFISGLLEGKVASFQITAWQNIAGIMTPQQTTIINATPGPFFRFGGIVLVLFVVYYILKFLYKRYKLDKLGPAFIMSAFIVEEIIRNFLCGSDNPFANPFSICTDTVRVGAEYLMYFLLLIGLVLVISELMVKFGLVKNQFNKKPHKG